MKATVFTEEQLEQIKLLHSKGLGTRGVAKQSGFTRWIVKQAYKILGIKAGAKNIKLTQKLCSNCLELKSTNEFKKKKNRNTYSPICFDCKIKIKQKKATAKKDPKMQQVAELYLAGNGKRIIAKITGFERSTITRYLIELGINDSNRQNKQKPIPEYKICPRCPENGLQNIFNFKPLKVKGGRGINFKYCHLCYKVVAMERYEKIKHTPYFKLRSSMHSLIWYAMKNNGSSKNNETLIKYISYTISELTIHIENLFEPWMTWENHGSYNTKTWNDNDPNTWTWHLDHIIPQSDLPYLSMEDDNFKICWGLNNLRPYSAKQNSIDGGTKIRHMSNISA